MPTTISWKTVWQCERNQWCPPIENIIGENETKLSDAEAETIEGEITYDELANALKIWKWKESRSGWLYCWFFKFFSIGIGVFLLRVYKIWL